jgi:hypothetical protein
MYLFNRSENEKVFQLITLSDLRFARLESVCSNIKFLLHCDTGVRFSRDWFPSCRVGFVYSSIYH